MTFKLTCDKCDKIIEEEYFIIQRVTGERDKKYNYKKKKVLGSYHIPCIEYALEGKK